jgi:hypothetical protein
MGAAAVPVRCAAVARNAVDTRGSGLSEAVVPENSRKPVRAAAWLYPVITDGLALVAYAAAARMQGAARRYSWAVVTTAAGLPGLAQAAYLAGDATLTAPAALRFGVGAWPAIAAAIVAHLLHLLATAPSPPQEAAVDAVAELDVDVVLDGVIWGREQVVHHVEEGLDELLAPSLWTAYLWSVYDALLHQAARRMPSSGGR